MASQGNWLIPEWLQDRIPSPEELSWWAWVSYLLPRAQQSSHSLTAPRSNAKVPFSKKPAQSTTGTIWSICAHDVQGDRAAKWMQESAPGSTTVPRGDLEALNPVPEGLLTTPSNLWWRFDSFHHILYMFLGCPWKVVIGCLSSDYMSWSCFGGKSMILSEHRGQEVKPLSPFFLFLNGINVWITDVIKSEY